MTRSSGFSFFRPVSLALALMAAASCSSASPTSSGGKSANETTGGSGHPSPAAPAAAASSSASIPSTPVTYVGADALAAPDPSAGIQIETPDYDANDPNARNLIVQPGAEIFLCYYVTLPNTSEVDIGAFKSWMSPNSSHHFIVYQLGGSGSASGGLGRFGGTPQPNGTINTCLGGGGTWVYATSTPGEVVAMTMPDGVGLPFAASTQVVLNMHFINTGTSTLYPKVKLNLLFAQNVQQKAAAMVSFNLGINVPPATTDGPGTQTVSGTCTAPVGSNFFIMATHTHKHATAAVINYVSNGVSTEVVHTGQTDTYPADQQSGTGTDWEHPGVGVWNAPNFLTIQNGDSFTYSCTYSNTGTTAVTVGETAASNEMCMAIGYYFPAGGAHCN